METTDSAVLLFELLDILGLGGVGVALKVGELGLLEIEIFRLHSQLFLEAFTLSFFQSELDIGLVS